MKYIIYLPKKRKNGIQNDILYNSSLFYVLKNLSGLATLVPCYSFEDHSETL